jgi:dCMP deaminase
MFMEIASVVAKRSTCHRLNVGCVIAVNNRIISIGYNGPPPGEPHCHSSCPGRFDGCVRSLHAEYNAMTFMPPYMGDKDLYVTDSPCLDCARVMTQHGIKRVFFEKPYRNIEAIEYLYENRIHSYQVMPSGHVLDWHTKDIRTDAPEFA